jgi:hypothetical protein
MPKNTGHTKRERRIRRNLIAQGIDPDSLSGRWILALLTRGERAWSGDKEHAEQRVITTIREA